MISSEFPLKRSVGAPPNSAVPDRRFRGAKSLFLIYCSLYILACATKHFWILMLGRITGGVATSLLFSAFEPWVVCTTT